MPLSGAKLPLYQTGKFNGLLLWNKTNLQNIETPRSWKIWACKNLAKNLEKFWPKMGPQWDALGVTADGEAIILVEAKANVPELVSFCGAKDKKSLETISASLAETQRWLNCREPRVDWACGFYQYANRLAHLYFLREKAQIEDSYLVFLYFVEDSSHIRTPRDAWNSALKLQKKLMGLSALSLAGKAIELFINTNDIKSDHWQLATGNWQLTTDY